jgi:sodium-dependent dicarboxylate transporter 2/3/5
MGKNGYTQFLIPFASPVMILFFGGFVLASALQKYHVDAFIAEKCLLPFAGNPSTFLAAVILTTAFLSLWISNTVTAAIMLGIVGPYLAQKNMDDGFKKRLILAIPFASSIGGMGTPIGSPPNAIAIGLLQGYEIFISFIDWMLITIPLVLILLAITYIVLRLLFPLSTRIETFQSSEGVLTKEGKGVLAITAASILLYMSTPIHAIPEALIALLSTGALTAFGYLNKTDIKRLDWDVLLLMWGGLALGHAVEISGLAEWLLSRQIFVDSSGYEIIVFALIAVVTSTFMSNTATTALLLPVGFGMQGIDKSLFAITISLVCSLGMTMPISTPPTALAHATGYVSTREMAKAGFMIVGIAVILILLGYNLVIPYFLQ